MSTRRNYEDCPAECVYRVDWHDHPESSGYSMATGTRNWFGCMRLVAEINQRPLKPCLRDLPYPAAPGKFSLFEFTRKEREHGHQ